MSNRMEKTHQSSSACSHGVHSAMPQSHRRRAFLLAAHGYSKSAFSAITSSFSKNTIFLSGDFKEIPDA